MRGLANLRRMSHKAYRTRILLFKIESVQSASELSILVPRVVQMDPLAPARVLAGIVVPR